MKEKVVKITLPDGTVLNKPSGITGMEINCSKHIKWPCKAVYCNRVKWKITRLIFSNK